jgi:hypothetical protein
LLKKKHSRLFLPPKAEDYQEKKRAKTDIQGRAREEKSLGCPGWKGARGKRVEGEEAMNQI